MRKSIRAALFACAALSTLALASSAFAAYTSPKLVVGNMELGLGDIAALGN